MREPRIQNAWANANMASETLALFACETAPKIIETYVRHMLTNHFVDACLQETLQQRGMICEHGFQKTNAMAFGNCHQHALGSQYYQ